MDDERQELIRHLFAEMTAEIETAHDFAASGQAACISAEEYLILAHQIREKSSCINAYATTLEYLASADDK